MDASTYQAHRTYCDNLGIVLDALYRRAHNLRTSAQFYATDKVAFVDGGVDALNYVVHRIRAVMLDDASTDYIEVQKPSDLHRRTSTVCMDILRHANRRFGNCFSDAYARGYADAMAFALTEFTNHLL